MGALWAEARAPESRIARIMRWPEVRPKVQSSRRVPLILAPTKGFEGRFHDPGDITHTGSGSSRGVPCRQSDSLLTAPSGCFSQVPQGTCILSVFHINI